MGIDKERREDFSTQKYWQDRYTTTTDSSTFDWLITYTQLGPLIHALLSTYNAPRILNVGCGNSTLSRDLHDDGFSNLVSIDYAPSCIEQMRQRDPELEWEVQDATRMTYPDASFDAVVDKSTLDCLSTTHDDSARRYQDETLRVLKDTGVWIVVSYSGYREEGFGADWTVERHEVEVDSGGNEGGVHRPTVCMYVYILQKRER
ncbi:S-adenosyl-L-methionine-dependent methyltransferase [Saitoella complicata NRRL Y-17804]|uniref:Methyltransferase domain-containing protein n=1 Tax=Saitoella complicata (strain BCRC 22490 / CBS 7301 / JCM 7358 / NBRC 10748 / NRRL Y-17804) TaxID=698492 RepID=A0A0E9N8K9_SAICN|nr:S-adenosyl-L-methionine-dependent methyltransferase [Saitoella complicata NRRL Y-17804]ODQ55744.1 S-adenosyl-L-methionine-dependent methyltransferase [Saitoella complicata NRRL Y-17804]GAO46159.1 hypothetical protein G7K_0397-t1 [Saitoella complicata NRRL Y-17804]